MTSSSGTTKSFSTLRVPARWGLRSLRSAAVAVAAADPSRRRLGEPCGSGGGAAHGAHVYLLRGVLNVFSLGLDGIAAKLEAQGIPVTITNYLGWASVADEAAADYRSGRVKTIILVGHSSGATVLPDMVTRLDQAGAPVRLAIGLDSVFRPACPAASGDTSTTISATAMASRSRPPRDCTARSRM